MRVTYLLANARSRLPGQLLPSLTGPTAVVLATVGVSNAIRIVSSMALTRLLSAEAFGVVGILSSISFILSMVSDVGVQPFVVRHGDGADRSFLDQVWTARLIRSVALTGVMVVFSPLLAILADKPELQPAIAVWSTTFLLDGLTSMTFATAVREQQMKRLSAFELTVALGQFFITLLCAFVVPSFWAIIAGMIIGGVLKIPLSYVLFPDSGRRWAWSRSRTLELWKFSRFIAGSSILGVALSQGDKLFFARTMSLQQFGLYAIAGTLATAPMAIVSPYVHKLLYPAFASVFREAPTALGRTFYNRSRIPVDLYVLLVGVFIGVAPLIVSILYDPRYSAVGPIIQILAIAPLLAMNTWMSDVVMIAAGRPYATMMSNLVRVIWLFAGGTIAMLTRDKFLIIWVVGTLEIPALIYFIVVRAKIGVFDIARELEMLLAGGIGVAAGSALVGVAAGLGFMA